jgi:hypothetical protein
LSWRIEPRDCVRQLNIKEFLFINFLIAYNLTPVMLRNEASKMSNPGMLSAFHDLVGTAAIPRGSQAA